MITSFTVSMKYKDNDNSVDGRVYESEPNEASVALAELSRLVQVPVNSLQDSPYIYIC